MPRPLVAHLGRRQGWDRRRPVHTSAPQPPPSHSSFEQLPPPPRRGAAWDHVESPLLEGGRIPLEGTTAWSLRAGSKRSKREKERDGWKTAAGEGCNESSSTSRGASPRFRCAQTSNSSTSPHLDCCIGHAVHRRPPRVRSHAQLLSDDRHQCPRRHRCQGGHQLHWAYYQCSHVGSSRVRRSSARPLSHCPSRHPSFRTAW